MQGTLHGGPLKLSAADIVGEAIRRGILSDGKAEAAWEAAADRVTRELITELAPVQEEFLLDLSQFSAAWCPRQCGKTYAVARDLIITALEVPKRVCTYINATHAEARKIMWDDPNDGLPAVLRDHGLGPGSGVVLNISKMSVTFPNGSIVECMGMDSDSYAKIRGNKRDLIVVDEAQKAKGLKEAMADLIFCLAARKGRLRFIGTPNKMCRGYFADICLGNEPGWSLKSWTTRDVTPAVWEAALAMKARLRWSDDDPDWRRDGLGEWVRSEAGLILPVDAFGALHDGVPELVPSSSGALIRRTSPLRYLAGVDLGFVNDPFAIVVLAYSMDEGTVYEVFSQEWEGLGTDEQAAKMQEAMLAFPGLNKFVVDDGGQGKQIADDFRRRHRLNIVPAQKHDRVHMIEELRSSVRLNQTLVRRGSPLHSDLSVLAWDEQLWEKGEYQPADVDGRSIDHKFDAFRYAWREAKAYLASPPDEPPRTHDDIILEQIRREQRRQEDAVRKAADRARRMQRRRR